LRFATSKLADEGFVGGARDEHSDHARIYNVEKLIALLGKVADVLA
jgi:hypothetical protein